MENLEKSVKKLLLILILIILIGNMLTIPALASTSKDISSVSNSKIDMRANGGMLPKITNRKALINIFAKSIGISGTPDYTVPTFSELKSTNKKIASNRSSINSKYKMINFRYVVDAILEAQEKYNLNALVIMGALEIESNTGADGSAKLVNGSRYGSPTWDWISMEKACSMYGSFKDSTSYTKGIKAWWPESGHSWSVYENPNYCVLDFAHMAQYAYMNKKRYTLSCFKGFCDSRWVESVGKFIKKYVKLSNSEQITSTDKETSSTSDKTNNTTNTSTSKTTYTLKRNRAPRIAATKTDSNYLKLIVKDNANVGTVQLKKYVSSEKKYEEINLTENNIKVGEYDKKTHSKTVQIPIKYFKENEATTIRIVAADTSKIANKTTVDCIVTRLPKANAKGEYFTIKYQPKIVFNSKYSNSDKTKLLEEFNFTVKANSSGKITKIQIKDLNNKSKIVYSNTLKNAQDSVKVALKMKSLLKANKDGKYRIQVGITAENTKRYEQITFYAAET